MQYASIMSFANNRRIADILGLKLIEYKLMDSLYFAFRHVGLYRFHDFHLTDTRNGNCLPDDLQLFFRFDAPQVSHNVGEHFGIKIILPSLQGGDPKTILS